MGCKTLLVRENIVKMQSNQQQKDGFTFTNFCIFLSKANLQTVQQNVQQKIKDQKCIFLQYFSGLSQGIICVY